MAKSFREMMAQSGYSTRRADDPLVLREYDSHARRISSGSVGADRSQGPTGLLQDERGPLVHGIPATRIDDISTTGIVPVLKTVQVAKPKK
jgi:hypothetical protein